MNTTSIIEIEHTSLDEADIDYEYEFDPSDGIDTLAISAGYGDGVVTIELNGSDVERLIDLINEKRNQYVC